MYAYFEYPLKTRFNKIIPKNKIYEKASINTSLKDKIVKQVEKIIWLHKLSSTTLNLNATDNITEIQVFDIELKQDNLDEDVLRAIDKAIAFPIIFQLRKKDKIQIKSAYKRLNEADTSKWIVDKYFSSPWIDISHPKESLPTVLDLEKLYEITIKELIPNITSTNKSLKEEVETHKKLEKLQKQYDLLKAKRSKEKQFNKKVELNTQLKHLKSQIILLNNS
ncbi:DUF4391 domain-containing protein [Halarcobacter sp.]|uniref:DUF4391 domain-containing protein n=1 Tax=Halarcobacter sp. TaxID=2321133 RepID=UPI0029F4D9D4|nr:DUF4391 domain-containing protein [Halarcobacter sp.]